MMASHKVVLPPKVLTPPPKKGLQHPLHSKMKLLAVHLWRKSSDTQNFHQKIIKLSWNRGDRQQGPDISQCLKDGTPMQYQRMKIPIFQK